MVKESFKWRKIPKLQCCSLQVLSLHWPLSLSLEIRLRMAYISCLWWGVMFCKVKEPLEVKFGSLCKDWRVECKVTFGCKVCMLCVILGSLRSSEKPQDLCDLEAVERQKATIKNISTFGQVWTWCVCIQYVCCWSIQGKM